ncbi:MAG: hypothetical protein QNJ46_33865 [Leptolyngbyaceae cyanobacterium MO_188.B28]|nr:hypothetical protein [Leptolyngbyaceae cyanobacterium MO_188.B28]
MSDILVQVVINVAPFYDTLTDLPNRTLFLDRLKHALLLYKRRTIKILKTLFIDSP